MDMSRVRLDPQFSMTAVARADDWLGIIGTIGGTLTLAIGIGGYARMVLVTVRDFQAADGI